MPHLTLEYTDNLPDFPAADALAELNRVLAASGEFDEGGIKSRAVSLDAHRVGTSPDGRAFVHVKLAILSGRPVETKRRVSESLLAVLREMWDGPAGVQVQLCVEILEIERESYAKTVLGP